MAHLPRVTGATFDGQVLGAAQPVLVEFGAAWCPPCRVLEPILRDLASEYAGQVTIVQVDIDDDPQYVSAYGLRGAPTMLLFRDGAEAARMVGLRPKAALQEWIGSVVKGSAEG